MEIERQELYELPYPIFWGLSYEFPSSIGLVLVEGQRNEVYRCFGKTAGGVPDNANRKKKGSSPPDPRFSAEWGKPRSSIELLRFATFLCARFTIYTD